MTHWIVAVNPKTYDIFGAYEKYDFIDWTKSRNYEIGDTVYLYVGVPYQKIMFKGQVAELNLTFEQIEDDDEFWLDKDALAHVLQKQFVKFELLADQDTEDLSLQRLKEVGLNSAPQGPIKASEDLVQYIEAQFTEEYPDLLDITSHVESYSEGAVTTVTVNRYERNRKARRQCLAFHGYDCKVCTINFEQIYGEVGKDFIHVHHIVPLEEIGETYEVDPLNDLVPVCPNCHAMLHKKVGGKLLSVEELKEMISQK